MEEAAPAVDEVVHLSEAWDVDLLDGVDDVVRVRLDAPPAVRAERERTFGHVLRLASQSVSVRCGGE